MIKAICLLVLALAVAQGIMTTDNGKKNAQPLGDQHEQWFNEQILDHFAGGPKKYWKQRWFSLPDYFDGEFGPMFLYICGESTCNGMPESRTFTKVLAEQHKGIVITLEHRFYGESQPFGQNENSYSTENLRYLTHEQGLEDLAIFIGWIKQKGYYGIHQNTPVITVGGSYPGAMSAWFRYKYKHLTIGGYASSAVVHAIEDFQDYDKQIGISASYSGEWCPQDIKKINDYVERQLQDEDSAAALKAQFDASILSNDEFLEFFADVFSGLVQYGQADYMCNKLLKNKTIKQQLANLAGQASDADSYTVEYLQKTAYDRNANARQWFYQTCTAFGWFQTAYVKDPFRSLSIDLEYFENKCKAVFGEQYVPNVPQTNIIMGSTELRVNNLIFTNGIEDPWQWASILKDEPPMKAAVAACQTCAHCCDLSTPTEDQPIELTYVQDQVAQNVELWLQEYRQQVHGENYKNMDFGTKPRVREQRYIDYLKDLEERAEKSLEEIFGRFVKVF